jgi:hypothetical protein
MTILHTLSILSRSSFISGSLATLVAIAAIGTGMGASPSTMTFSLVLGAVPWILMLLLPRRALSPTVAEILYAANSK